MTLSKSDLIAGVMVTVLWGCNFSVIEMGLRNLDPYILTLLRFTLCSVPLIFFIRRPSGVSLKTLFVYGVLFGAGLWWTVNFAMASGLSPGMSSVFLQFSAFFTIILSAIFLKEKLHSLHVCGMTFALVGLVMMLIVSGQQSTVIGILLVLAAALAWSLCNLIVKIKRPGEMVAFIVWSSLFSVPAIFVLTIMVKGWEPFYSLSSGLVGEAIFSIVFQSYVTTIVGYWVWNNLMKKYPVSSVAPLSLLVPVSGVAASHIFFGESMSFLQGTAVALVLMGIVIFLNAHNFKLQTRPD